MQPMTFESKLPTFVTDATGALRTQPTAAVSESKLPMFATDAKGALRPRTASEPPPELRGTEPGPLPDLSMLTEVERRQIEAVMRSYEQEMGTGQPLPTTATPVMEAIDHQIGEWELWNKEKRMRANYLSVLMFPSLQSSLMPSNPTVCASPSQRQVNVSVVYKRTFGTPSTASSTRKHKRQRSNRRHSYTLSECLPVVDGCCVLSCSCVHSVKCHFNSFFYSYQAKGEPVQHRFEPLLLPVR